MNVWTKSRLARHLFFEGGRQIPMTGRDREALLTGGLRAVFDRNPANRLGGQWVTVERQGWPGSMGASSFVLAGLGSEEALDSASHGAGRALSRGDASRSGHREFDDFLANFRVVTPLDFRRPETRRRADIWRRKIEELRAEGPHAYKGIRAIIDTLAEAGIAKPVAELVPLMTIKG